MVNGIQSQHFGASVKLFAVNNKETNRKNSDSRVSERAAREIYLIQVTLLTELLHNLVTLTKLVNLPVKNSIGKDTPELH